MARPVLLRGDTRRLTRADGFLRLVGRVLYDPGTRDLKFIVTSVRHPQNRGRSFCHIEHRAGSAHDAVRAGRELSEILDGHVESIRRRQLPARDFFLEKCLPDGGDVGTFLTEICTHCACWYCTVRGVDS